ncbi:hypothetical protein IG631_09215 [Alternaria alternata]|nr:hypothetical protein IG631_09215 [Alternaria alternata]
MLQLSKVTPRLPFRNCLIHYVDYLWYLGKVGGCKNTNRFMLYLQQLLLHTDLAPIGRCLFLKKHKHMIGLMRPLCHLGVRRVSWITSAVPDRPHLRCTSGMYKYPIDPTMRTHLKA